MPSRRSVLDGQRFPRSSPPRVADAVPVAPRMGERRHASTTPGRAPPMLTHTSRRARPIVALARTAGTGRGRPRVDVQRAPDSAPFTTTSGAARFGRRRHAVQVDAYVADRPTAASTTGRYSDGSRPSPRDGDLLDRWRARNWAARARQLIACASVASTATLDALARRRHDRQAVGETFLVEGFYWIYWSGGREAGLCRGWAARECGWLRTPGHCARLEMRGGSGRPVIGAGAARPAWAEGGPVRDAGGSARPRIARAPHAVRRVIRARLSRRGYGWLCDRAAASFRSCSSWR